MKIETTILKNLLQNEDYTRKVLPFLEENYFTDNNEKQSVPKDSKKSQAAAPIREILETPNSEPTESNQTETKKPTAKKPAAKKTTAKKPAAKKTTVKKPTAKKTVAKKTVSKKSDSEK